MRNNRERGLAARARGSGVSLPVQISYATIPVLSDDGDAEDGAVELVEWPFLAPYDFAPSLFSNAGLVLLSFLNFYSIRPLSHLFLPCLGPDIGIHIDLGGVRGCPDWQLSHFERLLGRHAERLP